MTTYVVTDTGGWTALGSGDLPASGVTPGTYGNGSNVGQFTVAADGTITAATDVAISGTTATEVAYGQVTANVPITDTSEATGTALITAGPATYSGAVVVAEFYCPYLQGPSSLGDTATITLFEGSTELGRLVLTACYVAGLHTASQAYAAYRFTPVAGTHTYKICGFVSTTTGTPQIIAGAGGTTGYAPAFLRLSYV